MAKKKEFCSVSPPYPMKGYVAILMVTTSDASRVMYPLYQIYTDLDEIIEDIGEYKIALTEGEGVSVVSEMCFLLPVTHTKLYELRAEFWQQPDTTYTTQQRISAFIQAMTKPEMFSLLVTPSKYKRSWRFMAALPLYPHTPDAVIEQFMLHSDWPVEVTAKYASLYRFEPLQVYNWVEKSMMLKPPVALYEEFIN